MRGGDNDNGKRSESDTDKTDTAQTELATKPHPYCRTDANARTSLYFSRLRTWFRDRLVGWATVAGSNPPTVARETEENGHHSGYLVYDNVYDAELILATWETAIGVQYLDLRLAPDFPPPMVLQSVPACKLPPDLWCHVPESIPSPKPLVYGAPYFSQPFAATTPRRITAREHQLTKREDEEAEKDGEDEPMDAQAVFRAMRVWGPVRTISIVSGAEDVREVGAPWGHLDDCGRCLDDLDIGTGKNKGMKRGASVDPSTEHDEVRKKRRTSWSVDVAFWYEEDAERLQREWDGVLGGWRA